MARHCPKNERIKRKYAIWEKHAKRKATISIDQDLAAIALFESSTGYKDFSRFHIDQARDFCEAQSEARNAKTGKPLAKATIKARLDALKAFFLWLADQPGYRSRIRHSDCEYFNMSAKDVRVASATRERPAPDLAQVHHVLDGMKYDTAIEKRDRALIAFTLLTGARDDAIASLSLRHVDLQNRVLHQDARDVRTKFAKTFDTWFFPVGGQAEAIVSDWIAYLKEEVLYGPDDPLFPQTALGLDASGAFAAIGLKRAHWQNADAIRRIFKREFEAAGLPYFNPHSLRKTLVRLGEKVCKTPEDFKAWSQNLGHEQVLTTFTSYGDVAPSRQGEIMKNLSAQMNDRDANIAQSHIDALEFLLSNAKAQRANV